MFLIFSFTGCKRLFDDSVPRDKIISYGRGEKLTISNNAGWNSYLFANKNIRSKIDGYVKNAIYSGKTSFSIKNDSVILDGYGGYFTGCEVLNGSNANYGRFAASGTIKRLSNGKYSVTVSFAFNDYVDPNYTYRSDADWEVVMRGLVPNKGNGRNYQLQINCTVTYIYG